MIRNLRSTRAGRIRASHLVIGAIGGAIFSAVAITGWLAATAERLPPLTEEALQGGERRWAEHGPRNYDIQVEVTTPRQRDQFELEVRAGTVVRCQRNGITPRPHTWETWSVAGQFETLQRELLNAADPAVGFGAPQGAAVVQRGTFDSHYGFPRIYERRILTTDLAIRWEVKRFSPQR